MIKRSKPCGPVGSFQAPSQKWRRPRLRVSYSSSPLPSPPGPPGRGRNIRPCFGSTTELGRRVPRKRKTKKRGLQPQRPSFPAPCERPPSPGGPGGEGRGEGERSKLQRWAHDDSRNCQTRESPRQEPGVCQFDYEGPIVGGLRFYRSSADRTLKVWEAVGGKLLRTFSHHTATVQSVTVRPRLAGDDRSWFCASGSDYHTVRIWQPEIGRMVRIVRQPEGTILALAYSRDGSRLFSVGSERVVRVIDGESDTILQKWKAHDDWIYSLALGPNGKILATGDWQGIIKLWGASSDAIRPMTLDKPGATVPQPKERGRLRLRGSPEINPGAATLSDTSRRHADADVCAPIRKRFS
jgi:hypothetical protein